MKKVLHLLFALAVSAFCPDATAQSHTSARPPVNPGYPFIRSLMVDCTDQIIDDIVNGSQAGLETDLLNYIRSNFISYVVLRDLENAGVFGDVVKEAALMQMITDLHQIVPDMQIGICAGMNTQMISQVNYYSPKDASCFNSTPIANADILEKEINSKPLTKSDTAKKAIINFMLQVANFSAQAELNSDKGECSLSFDALYLDYPFWNTTASMPDMKADFANYLSLLSVMQIIKCNSSCIRYADAEFLPTDIFKLLGWTAIDQITDADPLIDRIILPAYTYHANGVFNLRCKMMHYFSDQFSKKGSVFFIKMSAESSQFSYCNSPATPANHLGDYLNNFSSQSGNMYSVEKFFLQKFNDINYVCPQCNCSTYTDNHYTNTNLRGNILAGSMWTPYTMMKDHQLFRRGNYSDNNCKWTTSKIIDSLGKLYGEFNQNQLKAVLSELPSGLYFIVEECEGKISSRTWIK